MPEIASINTLAQAVLRLLSGLAATEGVGTMLHGEDIAKVAGVHLDGTGSESASCKDPMMIGFAGARLMCFLSGINLHRFLRASFHPGLLCFDTTRAQSDVFYSGVTRASFIWSWKGHTGQTVSGVHNAGQQFTANRHDTINGSSCNGSIVPYQRGCPIQIACKVGALPAHCNM